MIIKVVGIRSKKSDFNGKTYTGRQVYYIKNDNIDGLGCTTGNIYLGDQKFGNIDINLSDKYEILFNEYKKVEVFNRV